MLRPYLPTLLLLLTSVATSCAAALPSTAQPPRPVPSAAQPAVGDGVSRAYALRTLDGLRRLLQGTAPAEALARVPKEGLRLPQQGVAAGCIGVAGDTPLLLCHFGPEGAAPVAQGIFWHDRHGWQSQLYPQAPAQVAAERMAALAGTGCQVGCQGRFRQGRLARNDEGLELLAVVNLSSADPHPAEEVHLLRLRDDGWAIQWVPAAGDWHYGHASVTLGKGAFQFTVRNSSWLRQDTLTGYLAEPPEGEHRKFTELWVRKGAGFVLRDRSEEPTPFGALVRLIHYASTGADEKAAPLLGPGLSPEAVRQMLRQRPRRQGWKATRQGELIYLVQKGEGKPPVTLRFAPQGKGWQLVEAAVGEP